MCLGPLGEVERCVVGNEIGICGWLDVWRVETWDSGHCIGAGSARQEGDCSISARTNWGRRKEHDWTNRRSDCSTSAGTNWGGRKERGQTPPRPELIKAQAEPSKGERTKVERLEWRRKALIHCFRFSTYFWFPYSTLFWFLTVWPSSVRGKPKIQVMPVLSPATV